MKTAVVITFLLVVFGAAIFVWNATLSPIDLSDPVAVTVARGESMPSIAAKLDDLGLLRSKHVFRWWTRLRGIDRQIRPGRYRFVGPTRMADILDTLQHGHSATVVVTVPEGFTVERIAATLSADLGFSNGEFLALARDSSILRLSDSPIDRIEGYLWPETYQFYWGIEPRDVLTQMLEAARAVFDDSLGRRTSAIGWTRHQALTLASMIEAETPSDHERARISAVFHNRLKREMLLQCDPTVVYVLGGLPPGRSLSTDDLAFDSPYNTYRYPGLPPGPICNPGLSSIIAALYPDSTDELYFVANGHGSHIFSQTLEEHDQARARIRRQRGG